MDMAVALISNSLSFSSFSLISTIIVCCSLSSMFFISSSSYFNFLSFSAILYSRVSYLSTDYFSNCYVSSAVPFKKACSSSICSNLSLYSCSFNSNYLYIALRFFGDSYCSRFIEKFYNRVFSYCLSRTVCSSWFLSYLRNVRLLDSCTVTVYSGLSSEMRLTPFIMLMMKGV